jgi:hypothetical protein
VTLQQRLGLIQAKVKRAKKHVGDLETEIGSFLAAHPDKVRTKHAPETRQPIHYRASVKPTPIAVATITGDSILNLRSTLDHLAHALAAVGTGKPGPFPYLG